MYIFYKETGRNFCLCFSTRKGFPALTLQNYIEKIFSFGDQKAFLIRGFHDFITVWKGRSKREAGAVEN
ncbi:MAG: hypothetical protein AMJ94_05895 [Deltaproteobacteria bacterium SM23_61]|nr:MAG: hypothetical protein AMJ94_05895 [Deltaproteobacteria bacterium SM23_61]